jgi:hypothetical protein
MFWRLSGWIGSEIFVISILRVFFVTLGIILFILRLCEDGDASGINLLR